ncbi:hypothetical protein [Actinokineospora inagensis]|uniref:hypothetical protein n=1 Tax=Actinokineospora inagensis TaxID=103730 RepID=UPI001B7FAAD8|nr:hypothetical protein [Actinokineospora inagensis]
MFDLGDGVVGLPYLGEGVGMDDAEQCLSLVVDLPFRPVEARFGEVSAELGAA